MKKKLILSMIALVAIAFFAGCTDDEKKSNGMDGTWEVVGAKGVEWKENAGNTGAGTIINTNDPDTDMIGETCVIEGTEITLFGDTYGFEFSNGVLIIDLGDGTTETFNVEFDGSKTMYWTQDAPTKHEDYEERGPGNFLDYQKSLTLERQ